MRKLLGLLIVAGLAAGVSAPAQVTETERVPVYRVIVVNRTIKAINYSRGGSSELGFAGTSLAPQAQGSAHVSAKKGAVRIDAEFKHLPPASSLGPAYLTYVLWAISPEGRPANLGELILNGDGNAKLEVTTALQAFGLMVTAEPYFAVTQPSDLVVLENVVTGETNGTIEEVDAKYQLLQRGQYTENVLPGLVQTVVLSSGAPLAVAEAVNAVRIAKWAGADEYAPDTIQTAERNLANAQALAMGGHHYKEAAAEAREAVQTAEDARVIAVKRIVAEQQAADQAQAQEQSAKAAQAQAQAAQAQADAAQAAREKAEAEDARQAAETGRAQAQAAAEQARADAAQASRQAAQAQQRAAQAESEKTAMRAKLLQQLNSVLETRDTPRGLVVTMVDLSFGSGRYALRQDAREKLAKLAGVLLAYPGLKVEVDGYSDETGREETNQVLSERRANAVRDYLVSLGVPPTSITAQGLGDSNPVASNDSSMGRRMNRRVELVLSGDVIGTPVASVSSAPAGTVR